MKRNNQHQEDISKYANYTCVRNGVQHFYEYGKEVNRYRVWFEDENSKQLSIAKDKFGWLVSALDYGSARKEVARLKAEGKNAWIERVNPPIKKGGSAK